jgi:transposase
MNHHLGEISSQVAAPRFNPVERIWHYLRSHWLANSAFTRVTSVKLV